MDRERVYPKVLRYIVLGCISFGLFILCVFYIPKMGFYYNDLPHLEGWKQEGDFDIVINLPEAFESKQTLCFWSDHQKIQVYLEGQELYSMPQNEEASFSKIVPFHWNRIEIPGLSAGRMLRIHSETKGIPLVKEYIYGTDEQINQWIHQHYGMYQLVDTGLIGIGLFFIIFGILSTGNSMVRNLPLYLGLAMILMGTFLRTGLKGIPLYWMSDYTRDLICYFTFFSSTIPMFLYISKKGKVRNGYRVLCEMMALVQTVFLLTIFTLHAMKICDISRMIFVGLIFCGIFVILAFTGALIVFIKQKDMAAGLTLFSAVLIVLSISLEAVYPDLFTAHVKDCGSIFRICFILVVVSEGFCYSINVQHLEKQKERTEEENKKLQFQLLSSRIRPHFILNTLGAIRSMIMVDAEKASDLLYEFSMYLRKNIEEKDYTKPIPFGEELDYIETYLRLEQTRFGERLNVEYQIEEKAFWVLPLTIQPFVENAVKHGLFPKKMGGTIKIFTFRPKDQIVIEILDDGVGFDPLQLQTILKEKKSVGLRSAIYRIQTEMKGKCDIIKRNDGVNGTLVRITLPEE